MPKFIGRTIPGAAVLEENNVLHRAGGISLSYAQAAMLPAAAVTCSLCTSDRGSRGSLAKRWYLWSADAAAILAFAAGGGRISPSMRDRAGRLLDRIERLATEGPIHPGACRAHADCAASTALALGCARAA